MAKHLTPIVGLAVVVALALAAVFGSMSLANPALAQDDRTPGPTGLAVYQVNATSITVNWDAQDGFEDDNYQARAYLVDNGPGGVAWGAAGTGITPTTGDANMAEVGSLTVDETYVVEVRSTKDNDISAPSSVEATPKTPPTATISAQTAEPADESGKVVLEWTVPTSELDDIDGWQYDGDPDVAGVDNTGWMDIAAANLESEESGANTEFTATVEGYNGLAAYLIRATEGYARSTASSATTAITPKAASVRDLDAQGGNGYVRLSWRTITSPNTHFSYSYFPTDAEDPDEMQSGRLPIEDGRRGVTVDNLTNGTMYTFEITLYQPNATDGEPPVASGLAVIMATPMAPVIDEVDPSFKAGSTSSGSNTNYTVKFQIGGMALNTLRDELVIEFHEDYTLPSSISTSAVTIDVDGADDSGDPDAKTMLTFNPSDIVVDGEKAVFSLGDMNEDDDLTQYEILPMAVITVNFRQAAGIRNPTEAGDFNIVEIEFGSFKLEYDEDNMDHADLNIGDAVRRKISLSEEDGGLGDMVMATAKGFENGVTLHFFLDKQDDKGRVNGMLDSDEDILCSVERTSGANVGACEFEVTTPTFSTGYNFVNAVDGDGNMAWDPNNDDHRFELKASISASPAGGSPGEIMQVQLVSYPSGMAIQEIKLSGDYICGGTPPGATESVSCSSFGTVGSMGTASIAITVPNWAVAGVQELRIKAGGKTDTTNVTIVGPRVISTPSTVVANQRVSLVGTGFSPNSVLGNDTEEGRMYSKMSIGGHPIPWTKVNDGRDVNVDDGGNWAASVDLPLVEATTGSGERAIRITDSMGRTGSLNVSLAERNFDITPESGRVGTLAVVRGVGYPSKNDEGHSFTIDVIYKVQEGATARVSVVPDASGRFEVQLRIPTTASIPSTNQVEVSFDHEMGGTSVLENKQHHVPEGIIELSATSGGPGTTVTVSGEGFKTFVPVESVKIGTIEITPAPKPNTDANGMLEFDVLIPGLDVGIQTVEVKVGGTTSSTGFTVTKSAVAPGDIQAVAKAIEELGDNLVSVWNFNNDTKVWSFYDPTLEEGNTLTHMITGETYLLRISSTQEVILNRETRNLTCVGGNCWNQVVW